MIWVKTFQDRRQYSSSSLLQKGNVAFDNAKRATSGFYQINFVNLRL